MIFSVDELTALQGDVVNIGLFFRLDTTTPVRLWLGFGNVQAAVNVFDPSGAQYVGFGDLTSMPAINQLINGAAERVEFIMSGVSGDVMALAAANDADAVKGKAVAIGLGIFDDTWQLLGAPHWFANYTADYLKVEQQVVSDPVSAIVRTITLSCGSTFTGRRRPSYSYFSDADQQGRFSGDLSCSLVPIYAHGFNKEWPVF